jgi:uncharacterized membrane protein
MSRQQDATTGRRGTVNTVILTLIGVGLVIFGLVNGWLLIRGYLRIRRRNREDALRRERVATLWPEDPRV